MQPIVNPVFFYVADTIPAVKCVSAIICAVAALAIFLSWANDEQIRKSLITAFGISLVLAIFVPTQETLYKMGVASFVTPDNIYYQNAA